MSILDIKFVIYYYVQFVTEMGLGSVTSVTQGGGGGSRPLCPVTEGGRALGCVILRRGAQRITQGCVILENHIVCIITQGCVMP